MIGRIIKIHSDFYYADTEKGIIEAKLRSVLKKRRQEVYIGDWAELEQFDENSRQAFISEIKPRCSVLMRPKAANITRIIIVSPLKEPDLDFEQLDRCIALAVYHKIEPVLCFNKEDIAGAEKLKAEAEKIYKPLGYKMVFTSALEKTGIDEIRSLLKDNVSVLCGVSGAGKSSLINAVLNSSKQKISAVSGKTQRGMHTTRHSELIQTDKNSYTADTPGFSQLKFNFLPPAEIQKLFVEFTRINAVCRFKNCLHTGENGCGFEDIIQNMVASRYESYKKFILEAEEYEEKISNSSIKKEENAKYNNKRVMTKISHKKRALTRRTAKQKIYKEETDYE